VGYRRSDPPLYLGGCILYYIKALKAVGDYVYVAKGPDGLQVFDAVIRKILFSLGRRDGVRLRRGGFRKACLRGGRKRGLKIVDVTNPHLPQVLGPGPPPE